MRQALLAGLMVLVSVLATQAQEQVGVQTAHGAVLRALDTMTGQLEDMDISVGQTLTFKRLEITLGDCRYPLEHPESEAYAFLNIRDIRENTPRFQGWMVASSPALSAMDHPRYDVWVLRCRTPEAETSDDG